MNEFSQAGRIAIVTGAVFVVDGGMNVASAMG